MGLYNNTVRHHADMARNITNQEPVKNKSPSSNISNNCKQRSLSVFEKQESIPRRHKKTRLKIDAVHFVSIRVGAVFDRRKNTLPERMDLQSSHKIGCLARSPLDKDGAREPEMH